MLKSTAKYGLGQVVRHRKHPFRGVIFDIDPQFANTDEFNIFSVLSDTSLNAENSIIKEQVETDVRRLVEELPEDQKEVLLMRIYEDLSFKEISDKTGVSINTALGRMRYALINLRKIIDKHHIILTN